MRCGLAYAQSDQYCNVGWRGWKGGRQADRNHYATRFRNLGFGRATCATAYLNQPRAASTYAVESRLRHCVLDAISTNEHHPTPKPTHQRWQFPGSRALTTSSLLTETAPTSELEQRWLPYPALDAPFRHRLSINTRDDGDMAFAPRAAGSGGTGGSSRRRGQMGSS